MDALLDEAEATVSRGVIEIACRLNQGSTSFQHTADMLFRAAHIPSNKETLRQLIEAEGRAVLSAMQQSQLTPDWAAEDCRDESGVTRLYIGCDGVSIPLVTDEEKRKRRQNTLQKRKRRGRKGKPLPRRKTGADNAYKEFKVARIYDQTMAHCLVGVTSGNCEAAGRMMRRMELQVAMSEADQRIALFDGAPWIRNQIEFHSLADHSCLDFYHLQDYAQKTRRSVFGEACATGKQWLGELMHAFKHDGYGVGMERLWETRKSLRGGKRSSLDSLIQYAAERRDIICYPQFRDQGWQIGSGPTESSCKTTTHRVKGRGRRWDSRNAEAMMALSALHDSKLWNKHWLTQETVSI